MTKTLVLLFWLISTFFLTLTVVGLFVFLTPDDYNKSTWMTMGLDLTDQKFSKIPNNSEK